MSDFESRIRPARPVAPEPSSQELVRAQAHLFPSARGPSVARWLGSGRVRSLVIAILVVGAIAGTASAAWQVPWVQTTQKQTAVNTGRGAVSVPADLGESLDLTEARTAVQIDDAEFIVAPGAKGGTIGGQSLQGMTCFAMIVHGPAGSQMGCNPAAAVAREGLGFSFSAPDGSVRGAVLLPEGYSSVTLNGSPVDSPGGIVSYSAKKGQPIVIAANGPGGPITRRAA